jgi:hypothetical protein
LIISTTLTGSNADIIGEAIASVVAQVDRCLVVDTGARDGSVDVAREVAGEKLLLREFPWKNDFAAARNFALQAATEAGGAWAVTIDTDERLLFDAGVVLREALGRTRANVLLVADDGGTYSKERIVRLPAEVHWSGPTHEVLEGQSSRSTRASMASSRAGSTISARRTRTSANTRPRSTHTGPAPNSAAGRRRARGPAIARPTAAAS